MEQNDKNKRKYKVLLVDDEDVFRVALAKQLTARGYEVIDIDNGRDAIKIARHEDPDVVLLDMKMPGMDGIQTLQEIKKVSPVVQIVMLTGQGSIETARLAGKHDVFQYLEKPCDLGRVMEAIEKGAQEKVYALARHEIWLVGTAKARPGVILLGILIFTAMALMPTPQKLESLLSARKFGELGEKITGYSEYRKMSPGENIVEHYSRKTGMYNKNNTPGGKVEKLPFSVDQGAFRAKVMIGLLIVAALFWATAAIPIGITALLVGVIMYFFGVLPPNLVAKAYAKDSVIFIFGVLAMSSVIGKTGLDRRIGILLLGRSTSLARFAFIFGPLLAVTASFLSEHALVAFLAPILFMVYRGALDGAGIKKDKALVVFMFLMLTYTANIGGPGSPAAGGRNAVMLGIFADYGITVSFGQWVKMGLPFVPVMAIVIAAYFYFTQYRKVKIKNLNVAEHVRRESEKIGKMTMDEYKAAGVLILLIVLWTTMSSRVGMGGPVLLALVLLNILGVARWRDMSSIHWDVVALYAAASAMGYGLATTGAALWLADSAVSFLPEVMSRGMGLCVSVSLLTGILTNFMSDGATVAAVGPITVPTAMLAGTSPVMVGLATAFSSSFAHMLIIGTPNNAIMYSLAKDPDTGEQLVTMKDFLYHGTIVLFLSLAVLWIWVFFGYWRFIQV